MAILINGNGNPAVYANQDADLIASLAGNVTSIAAVGNEFEATQEDSNTIGLADGVIITQEGRRIQLDEGNTDLFSIPTGQLNVTNYYIIGYKLTTDADNKQVCETFVQKMNSASETITEDTFKGGATDVYVSVYRVTQVGLNIDSIDLLLPKLSNISQIKSALTERTLATVTGDGVKTIAACLNELVAGLSGLTDEQIRRTHLDFGGSVCPCSGIATDGVHYCLSLVNSTSLQIYTFILKSNASARWSAGGTNGSSLSVGDAGQSALADGYVIKLVIR